MEKDIDRHMKQYVKSKHLYDCEFQRDEEKHLKQQEMDGLHFMVKLLEEICNCLLKTLKAKSRIIEKDMHDVKT